jgi:glycosyltransferase involved in cell wall biosynthesis
LNTNRAFDPVAVLLVDVPETVADSISWRDLSGFPKQGYRRARVYLRHRGTPYAKLNITLDEDGFPLEPFPNLDFQGENSLASPQPTSPASNRLPFVSIVISTAGLRQDLLGRCIMSLVGLAYPKYEIIVVDNRTESMVKESPSILTDSWLDDVGASSKVTTVREKRQGLSFARNTGVEFARGDIVAFTDDDVEVDSFWLEGLVEAFDTSNEVMCVTGLVIPAELETEAQELCEIFYGGFDRGLVPRSWVILKRRSQGRMFLSRSSFLVNGTDSLGHSRSQSLYVLVGNCGVGANFAVRREFALRFPFDVALGAGSIAKSGEDTRFYGDVLWSGYGIKYAPRSIVRHTHRRDMEALESQIRGVGVGLTALIVSLMFEDKRHVVGVIICGAPSALFRWIASAFSGRSAAEGRDDQYSYPRSLRRTELVGMMLGPSRYISSRRHARSIGRVG